MPVLSKQRETQSIAFIEGLATSAVCGGLIHRSESCFAPAMVGDYATGQWIRDPIRTGLAAPFAPCGHRRGDRANQKRLELASGPNDTAGRSAGDPWPEVVVVAVGAGPRATHRLRPVLRRSIAGEPCSQCPETRPKSNASGLIGDAFYPLYCLTRQSGLGRPEM